MPPALLFPLLLLSASIAIYGEIAHRRRLVYAFKPLTTLLVIVLAITLPAADSAYRLAILLGLGFSLVGDVFLMLPADRFLPGLVAFLLAHLAYLAAFTRYVPLGGNLLAFAVVAMVSAVIVSVLWGGVPGRMRVPVLAYVVVLGMMAAQAITQGIALAIPAAWAGAVGGAVFVFSDATLAYDRFRRRFRWARAIVLASYWTAQALIALSVAVAVA